MSVFRKPMKTPLQDVIKNSRLVVPVTYKLPKQPARSLPPPQLSILCWSKVAQPASGPRNVWFMSPSAVSLPVTRHIEMAEKVWNVSWDMHAALRWSFNETEIRSGYCSPTAHYPPPSVADIQPDPHLQQNWQSASSLGHPNVHPWLKHNCRWAKATSCIW